MKRFLQTIKNKIKLLKLLVDKRTYINPILKRLIVTQFHKLYYDSHAIGETWLNTFWLGHLTMKCPFDMWIYQEIIYEIKPDLIIECGTAYGGSALFLASICNLLNHGKVISIDIQNLAGKPEHKRLIYLQGSSVSEEIIKKIKKISKNMHKILVILDSDHHKNHVLQELKIYCQFVTKGSYLIVEDSNINGNPVFAKFGPGPREAIDEFIKYNGDYVIDRSREKFYLTFNPNGYLKKIR